MSRESYIYDESLGIYGHESHARLARAVMQDLIRYEETCENVGNFLELPHLDMTAVPDEEFRVSSIVDSPTAKIGYALAVARADQSDVATMGGVFYRIDREDPSVQENKGLVVARPETFVSNRDYQDEIEGLMHRFDRSELEAVMRMLGKMTISLEMARKLQRAGDEGLESLSVAARMKADTEIKRAKDILERTAVVEPYVLSALHNYKQDEVRALFPVNRPFLGGETSRVNNEHLMEWNDFTQSVDELLRHENTPDSGDRHLNIHYEIDSKLYYVKLVIEDDQLIGVQMLCDDTGAWKSQLFDLYSTDADESGRNDINPMWDKSEVLASLRDGEIIDDEAYEYYRMLAENSLKTSFSNKGELIQIKQVNKKRPAA